MLKKLIWFSSGVFLGILLAAAAFAGIAVAAEATWQSDREDAEHNLNLSYGAK